MALQSQSNLDNYWRSPGWIGGTVNVTLFSAPQPGEMLTTRFGLQAHQGCLPGAQPVGLNGSRAVEWGRVTFVSVTTG